MQRNRELEKKLNKGYKGRSHGHSINFDNPTTMNEKLQLLKLYDSTPLKGKLADKYEAKEWLRDKLGEDYSIPTLGIYDSFDEIDFDELPNSFIMKATHGSGGNITVLDKSTIDKKEAKKKFDNGLSKNYSNFSFELHYNYIKPRIIIEPLISKKIPFDYRFFCFNGEPKEIYVDTDSGTSNHARNIYYLDWNLKDAHNTYKEAGEIEKPLNLDKMIEISKTIAKEFLLVRIDFYEVDSKLYIGELTFTPTAGLGSYKPISYKKGIDSDSTFSIKSLLEDLHD